MTDGDDRRPDPDALLKRVQDAAAKEGRARLKIWFGMAPGVGKTYAMLEAARRTRESGVDLVVGWVETHGREETAALLRGLEVLPPRVASHRGARINDFDLDAALARKPAVLLLDELAHTNAPGGRHDKRWQDVLDLLDAGIDVHTTLNVQHVDSLIDVVKDVTGVAVRESVPDHILDRADEIELIDLPPDELLQRLAEGKVYLGEAASRALEHFFRRGNLLALRELALRRTADRVDADVRAWREEHAIAEAWASREKILVCVGATPENAEVIRAARRLADRLKAPWAAVHVEASDRPPLSDQGRARVEVNIRLAESLGAEVAWLSGQSTPETIVAQARRLHVTRIVVGKHLQRRFGRLRSLLRPTLVEALLAAAGDMEVDVVACAPPASRSPKLARERRAAPADYVFTSLGVALATAISLLGRDALAQPDVAMIYVASIMLVALRFGRGPSILAAAMSVLAYNFFFVPPHYSLGVADSRHWLTFFTMFSVGLLIGTLTLRLRRQEEAARERESRTSTLFSLARDLAAAADVRSIAATAVSHAARIFSGDAVIWSGHREGRGPESHTRLEMLAQSSERALAASEVAVAQWVLEHGRPAGIGADALPGALIACFPLESGGGVLGLRPADAASFRGTETRHFAELFARQVALALTRAQLSEMAHSASIRAETEVMRSTLLSSVSHDLRTPLASITGAATTLRDADTTLIPSVRRELVEGICDEAVRLEHLVDNLLDMTRLDSGAVTPRPQWVPTEELIGAVLVRLERELAAREVVTRIAPKVAYLEVDPLLFGQLLGNLVENAIKYSPAQTSIEIEVEPSLRGVEIAVRDHGPGFSPGDEHRIFERFYRGQRGPAPGAGLGLAIAQAIAALHGGEMAAMTRAGGGAVVTCTLPPRAGAATPPGLSAPVGEQAA